MLSLRLYMEVFAAEVHDRMTECVYDVPLATFDTNDPPQEVFQIDLLGGGAEELARVNDELGKGGGGGAG